MPDDLAWFLPAQAVLGFCAVQLRSVLVGRGRDGIFSQNRQGACKGEHLPEEPNPSILGDWQQEGMHLPGLAFTEKYHKL